MPRVIDTPLSPSVPAPAFRETTASRAVFAALSRMRRGSLAMRLPDGSARVFGGGDPVAEMIVTDAAFFEKCLLHGDIGFAESHIDGDWDTPDLGRVFAWFLANAADAPTLSGSRAKNGLLGLLRFAHRIGHLLRPNTRRGARRNIADHYDLSNDFFALWLDPSMLYSSALFERPDMTLPEAQTAKIDRLCRLADLKPGMRVLEIGCGWGAFAIHAAKHYGVRVTGLTISARQAEWARRRVGEEGLADRIEIRLSDFRDFEGEFDAIVSIEMMEALGHANVPVFCAACDRLLAPHGRAALQFITVPDARYDELRKGVDFIQKHIFPGSLLLSPGRVDRLLARHGRFTRTDTRELAGDYAETLRRWEEAFQARLGEVGKLGFDAAFMRKWRYYLKYCEAAFAARHIGVVQTLYVRETAGGIRA